MNEKKFDGMGQIYAKYRPTYPKSFIDYLYNQKGFTDESIIADIGAGTGIFAEKLLERKSKVFAVEPNTDMSKIAKQSLSVFSNLTIVGASAENTTLKDKSVDFITVAQAFHWFDRTLFKVECKRILKHNGLVVLVWNSRDNNSELVMKNDEINSKYCPDFKGFSGAKRGAESDTAFADFFTGIYETRVYENHITYDRDGFIGRNLSASYALKETDDNYKEYIKAMFDLFDCYANDGFLIKPNYTRCYIGKL